MALSLQSDFSRQPQADESNYQQRMTEEKLCFSNQKLNKQDNNYLEYKIKILDAKFYIALE